MNKFDEAKKTKIFVINPETEDLEQTTLYDLMMKSEDITTTPRGVGSRLFMKQREYYISKTDADDRGFCAHSKKYGWRFDSFIDSYDFDEAKENGESYETPDAIVYYFYEIMTWGVRGNNLSSVEEYFETEDAANDYLFEQLEYDFEEEDRWDTRYWDSEEDAEEALCEFLGEAWGVDADVAKSIRTRKQLVENEYKNRRADWLKNEASRIDKLSTIYAKMIDKVDGEKYKETCRRLSGAIGEKVEKKVFHEAVKKIRR